MPIGLISTNWGGTRIEPWIPPEGFSATPELAGITKRLDCLLPTTDCGRERHITYLIELRDWAATALQALQDGRTPAPPPTASAPPTSHQEPTKIYNRMIHPILGYGIRGAIWYQGESNGGEGESYYDKMRALIGGWRRLWGQGDFPFYYVQLANFQTSDRSNAAGGDGWANLREAQRQALTIPNTGMAVIIDIGAAGNIHPTNKQDVGDRLARWALAKTYEKNVVCSGPLFTRQEIETGGIRLHFDHLGGGLMIGQKVGLAATTEVKDGALAWFSIAGEDREWHPADARIDGDTVVVASAEVSEPVAVRYAFAMNPDGANLYNRAGLPASPFRTDDW